MPERHFAQVVVPVPTGRGAPEAFHYHIPPELEGTIRPGHLVWVSFGSRRLQGVVLALDEESPVAETKPVLGLVYSRPILRPYQIALARWLSETYLAPLHMVLEMMFPPGFGAHPETLLEPSEGVTLPDGLPGDQLALLEIVSRKPTTLKKLRREHPKLARRRTIDALARRGLIVKSPYFPPPSIHPLKRLKVAPVIPMTDRVIRDVAVILGRDLPSVRLLEFLLESGGSADLEKALSTAKASKGVARSLASAGWVEISGGRMRLSRSPDESWNEVFRRRGMTKKVAALRALADAGEPVWVGFLYATSGCTRGDLNDLVDAGLISFVEEEVWRNPLEGEVFVPDTPPMLTPEQKAACNPIVDRLRQGGNEVFLLYGVTGSGKTEIYLRAIEEVLRMGRQAVVLVPEISLTPQTVARFSARFPGRVTVWHSRLSGGERYDQWRRVHRGQVDVVVGSRSALFLPFPDLGLAVVDECHETSYKQPQMPRYHARDAAVALGKILRIPVILGSATPSLESFRKAKSGEYTLLSMPRRLMAHQEYLHRRGMDGGRYRPGPGQVAFADLPPVQVVDMREELKSGNMSIFSRALRRALDEVLESHRQAILFLNRRGSASFVMCRDCGYVMRCPRCGVPLTYHRESAQLICHHCGHREPVPEVCPRCGSKRIRYFNPGTERVEEELAKLYPGVRILRWDRDAAARKGAHNEIMRAFSSHEADVLIGTQMIAKGLDLPLVTLVGVVSADTSLFLPDFRAAERTFQLMTQVAGRAGRSALGGRVIMQTYAPDHYAIRAAAHHDYGSFYRQEMEFRRKMGYPPFRRLARLLYVGTERACRDATAGMKALLTREVVRRKMMDVRIIGPAPAFFSRLRGKHRWQILVLAPDPVALLRGVDFPPPWQVDVDPVDVL